MKKNNISYLKDKKSTSPHSLGKRYIHYYQTKVAELVSAWKTLGMTNDDIWYERDTLHQLASEYARSQFSSTEEAYEAQLQADEIVGRNCLKNWEHYLSLQSKPKRGYNLLQKEGR